MDFKDCCLSYPDYYDFTYRYDEGASPHVFNYFCIHGKQVFIRRSRRFYEVFVRGYHPEHFQSHTRLSNGQHHYSLLKTDNIDQAMKKFADTCHEILHSYVSIFFDSPPPF